MAKRNVPTRMSDDLTEVAEILAKRRKYRDRSEYIRALVRYDALVGGDEHAVTKPISEKSLEEQDKIDAELLKWVQEGKKGRGVLLDHLIKNAVDSGATDAESVKKKIADNL